MLKTILNSIFWFIAGFLSVELITFGFELMSSANTPKFYAGMAIVLAVGILIGYAIGNFLSSIINSIKNQKTKNEN